ncbi:hypothetical protein [Spiroplasma clarkii]|uniref:hypothetical protein n=1 Tax=Spiroplasma clarkii TaxID=2139 RepID=UPI0011BA8CE2|nr:hypothetical protein [Spiroplasma clarkii]
MYLTLSNEISRIKMLFSQIMLCILNIFIITAWSTLIMFLMSLATDYWQLIARISIVFFLYVTLVSTTLTLFILF